MPEPIPPYLFALAVGRLESRELGPRSRVWAEPEVVEQAAWDFAEVDAVLSAAASLSALHPFANRPELTCLRTHLQGVDPDESFSQVPYEKGCLFLQALEKAAGRARFDSFLRKYLGAFRFRSIASEQFVEFLERELPGF